MRAFTTLKPNNWWILSSQTDEKEKEKTEENKEKEEAK